MKGNKRETGPGNPEPVFITKLWWRLVEVDTAFSPYSPL